MPLGLSLGLSRWRGLRAALDLNLTSGFLDSRVTFSRGTNATLVDSTGKITYAPSNLLTYSQQFDDAIWIKSAVTVTANTDTAPDGTLTADKIIPAVASVAFKELQQNVTISASTSYTFSCYVKAAGYQYIQIIGSGAVFGTFNVNYDLSNGTETAFVAGTSTITARSITAAGNGWYRVSVTALSLSAASGRMTINVIPAASSTRGVTWASDGTSGILQWGAQLEPVTYQTVPGTYNATTTAAYYGPRFDYDPVTLASKGLLIEEQRVNLVLQSETFDNASWSKSGSTVTANATTSPDGTANADKLAENATSGPHWVLQSVTTTAVAHTATAFMKASERTWGLMRLRDSTGTDRFAWFNLATGAVGTVQTNLTASITSFGNGWYRCSITISAALAGSCPYVIGPSTADNVVTYTGDGTSGLFIWGAQLEAGAFATSYIPTVASQVTRSADVATMTGTNFSSWYNASEGSFVSSYEASPNTFTTYLAASNGVVAQNSMHMDNDGSGNMRVAYYSGSSAVALLTLGAVGTINAVNNVATAYKVNDFAASRNGGTVATDTAGAVPVGVNRLNIGADPSGAAVNVSNIHIRQIAYYNTRLPNAQLQALTA